MAMFMLGRGTHLLNNRKVLPLLLSGCSVTNSALIWLIKGMHRGRVVSLVFAVIGMMINKAAGDTVVVDDGRWQMMEMACQCEGQWQWQWMMQVMWGHIMVIVAVPFLCHHYGCCCWYSSAIVWVEGAGGRYTLGIEMVGMALLSCVDLLPASSLSCCSTSTVQCLQLSWWLLVLAVVIVMDTGDVVVVVVVNTSDVVAHVIAPLCFFFWSVSELKHRGRGDVHSEILWVALGSIISSLCGTNSPVGDPQIISGLQAMQMGVYTPWFLCSHLLCHLCHLL